MTNKLVRNVTKKYVAGTPGTAPKPAYCYTRTVTTQTSGGNLGSVGTSSPDTIGLVDGGGGTKVNGFVVPIFRQVDPPYVDDAGNLVTQEIVGYTNMRHSPDPVSQPSYTSTTETICEPAVPGIPGTPATVTLQNAGPDWRASARSIKSVAGDATASFNLAISPRAMVGFATNDRGANQADMRMGVFAAKVGGVIVLRPILNGVLGTSFGTMEAGSRLTLIRAAGEFKIAVDGEVEYVTAATTSDPVFLDAMLYTSEDFVDDPVLAAAVSQSVSGSVGLQAALATTTGVAGSVGLAGQVGLVADGEALLQVTGEVGFSATALVTPIEALSISGSVGFSAVLARSEYTGSQLSIGPLSMQASDYVVTNGTVVLPKIQVEGNGGLAEAEVAGADLVLAPLLGSALMYTGGLIESELELPALTMVAADRIYGEGEVTLPTLTVYGDDGFGDPNYYGHNELLRIAAPMYSDPTLLGMWVEGLELQAEMSFAVLVQGSFFEGLLLDPLFSIQDLVNAMVNSGVTLASATTMPNPELAQFAFDAATGAATRYDGFGFSGFVRTDHGTYGIKPDGVYRMREGDDDGAPRSALVDFGADKFGGSVKKHIHTMYIGMNTDGELFVKLSADGSSYKTYRVVGQQPTVRVRTGKGVTAREWSTKLEWVDSTSIELEAVEFVLAGSSRRWTR